MNFKEIRNLAISLYRQGKKEEEIQQICEVPIDKETIANWMQEDREKEKLNNMEKLTKKLKKIKKIEINKNNREEIVEQLKEISFEILKIDEENEIAMNELVRCYSMQREYDVGRVYGEKILNNNPNNIFALYNMARLEMAAGDVEKAKEYNERLLEIDSENKQGNIQKTIIEEKIYQERQRAKLAVERENEKKRNSELEEKIRQINLQEEMQEREIREREEQATKEFEKAIELEEKTTKQKSIEEEQAEFAKAQMEAEKYTLENQKKYMDELHKMFYEGKINQKNIEEIRNELYKYPDKIESAIFLSEIYYFIAEKEERGIEELNNYIDNAYTLSRNDYQLLDKKIQEFRDRIDYREAGKQREIEKQRKQKQLKIEQREYSRQIIKMIDNGELKKEDIPEIIKRLEKYPDRSKAIFLIMKLYEGYGDREQSLRFLAKYSTITNLSEQEKDNIIKMKKIIVSDKKEDVIVARQRRVKARKRQKNKNEKYRNKIDKDLVKQLIKEGNTVEEVYQKLCEKGKNISIRAITIIKSHLISKEPELQSKYEEELELAKMFLENSNYSIEQVYQLFGYNIAKNKLIEMKEQTKMSKENNAKSMEEK